MTVWYKQGVEGDLTIPAQKCLNRVHSHYNLLGKDLFITSKRDGNHSAGSLHYNGNAFDFRKDGVRLTDLKRVAGRNFDVVEHATHFHIEYDPKE
jgi:hypothetical protein